MATEQPRSSAVELLETKPDPADEDPDIEKPKPTLGENEKESVNYTQTHISKQEQSM